jgi:hypothetical protein
MSNDTARRQGWTDAQQNRGPMNTNGWDTGTPATSMRLSISVGRTSSAASKTARSDAQTSTRRRDPPGYRSRAVAFSDPLRMNRVRKVSKTDPLRV